MWGIEHRPAMTRPISERGLILVSEHALSLVQAYLRSQDTNLFAHDAEFRFMSQHEPLTGRQAIDVILGMLCRETFTHVRCEQVKMLGMENCVVAEFVFRGRNTGPLMGAPPTGKTVAIPMIAVCEVTGSYITRTRLYCDTCQIGRQLGLDPNSW